MLSQSESILIHSRVRVSDWDNQSETVRMYVESYLSGDYNGSEVGCYDHLNIMIVSPLQSSLLPYIKSNL